MSRPYEALAILKVLGSDAELAQSVKQLEEPIQKLGGTIEVSTSWGRRRLAYRILRQSEGVYHLLRFLLPPPQLDELKRAFRLNEQVVRFLILNRVNHQPAASAGSSSPATAASASQR